MYSLVDFVLELLAMLFLFCTPTWSSFTKNIYFCVGGLLYIAATFIQPSMCVHSIIEALSFILVVLFLLFPYFFLCF